MYLRCAFAVKPPARGEARQTVVALYDNDADIQRACALYPSMRYNVVGVRILSNAVNVDANGCIWPDQLSRYAACEYGVFDATHWKAVLEKVKPTMIVCAKSGANTHFENGRAFIEQAHEILGRHTITALVHEGPLGGRAATVGVRSSLTTVGGLGG